MANTLSSLGGFLSAFMVGSLTYENVSIKNLVLSYLIELQKNPFKYGSIFYGLVTKLLQIVLYLWWRKEYFAGNVSFGISIIRHILVIH